MNDAGPKTLEVCLGDEEFVGRVHIELTAFCAFDAWMDGQTEILFQKWVHLAAPAAARSRRTSALGLLS
jgi:hypothetical protein